MRAKYFVIIIAGNVSLLKPSYLFLNVVIRSLFGMSVCRKSASIETNTESCVCVKSASMETNAKSFGTTTLLTLSTKLFVFLICGALRDLVPFVQFKKREKTPWKSVKFSKVAGFSLQLY